MRHGTRLGIDVGRVRVGVAGCDPDGLLATPVATLARDAHLLDALAPLLGQYDPIELVVGLPLSLSGADTPSTADARAVAAELDARFEVPVRLVDERMSTNLAQQALRASGRSSRRSRFVVDQVAAVIILQSALDAERGTGRPAGVLVTPEGTL
ncbi:MAG: Holliday junction resolvase RuvX [Micrococcales bacterium]|nr:Holliday junction resolvase RuvX [Micrococcales bacterium]